MFYVPRLSCARRSSVSADEAFQQAQDQFIASLSQQEKTSFSKCSSPQELLDEVQKFEVISKNTRRGLGLLKHIKSFSDNLQPYFKVIEIIIQCPPQWAAIAWGSIRLVLQVKSVSCSSPTDEHLTKQEAFATACKQLCRVF